jgi:hypothetical protein
MMEDILLALLKRGRPSRYKGIGLRGGAILAIFWSGVCGIAGWTGWNVEGTIISAIAGGFVGYRLEKTGGAIAVATFSTLLCSIVAMSDCGPVGGVSLGTYVGLMIGLKTKERS